MGRKEKLKQVETPPDFAGFGPIGVQDQGLPPIDFYYEEYEAIRLVDYENLNFEQAAEKMKISKTSFARLIKSARKKITTAFVECRPLRATANQSVFDNDWYRCCKCYHLFSDEATDNTNQCPQCQHKQTHLFVKKR